jgi:peptidoglycan/LPS O-acetylase OafA/YrhL
MKSLNINYIPGVDHLRGFAALIIFLYHGMSLISFQLLYNVPVNFDHWQVASNPFEALVIEGHTAVCLFMVLSGFIFTIGAYQSEVRYFDFIRNRFLRTYPLFVLILLTGVFSFTNKFSLTGFVQSLFFMGNLSGAIDVGPFSSMLWAVAVEWQFYLVFPFILLFVNRSGLKYILGLILVFIAMRCFAALLGGNIRDLSYWTIIGRMDQFLLGIGAGVIYRRHFKAGIKFDVIFFFGAGSVLLLLFTLNQSGGWPAENRMKIIWPTIEGLAWATFILGYLSIVRWMPNFLSSILVRLGSISYSIYLIHFVVITIFIHNNYLLSLPGISANQNALLTSVLLILPIVLLVSTTTYHFIERPFLQLRHAYLENK